VLLLEAVGRDVAVWGTRRTIGWRSCVPGTSARSRSLPGLPSARCDGHTTPFRMPVPRCRLARPAAPRQREGGPRTRFRAAPPGRSTGAPDRC